MKNMKTPNDLKKSVSRYNIPHSLIVNNYSKCLMCAKTALQTRLKHLFLEKKAGIHISCLCDNLNGLMIPAEIDNSSNPLWKHATKIQSN